MPYIIIHVESEEDVKQIIFNETHGNGQSIIDWGGEGIAFEFVGRSSEEYAESTR